MRGVGPGAVLSTPRLHLVPLSGAVVARRLEVDDFEAVLELPDGSRVVRFGPEWPGAALASYPGLLTGGLRPEDHVDARYVAVDRDTPHPRAVAELGAKTPIGDDGSVEIGYGVNASDRGRGLGSEAVGALVAELASRGATRVVAHTVPDNLASRRVLENNGFTLVGATHEAGHGKVDVWERRTP